MKNKLREQKKQKWSFIVKYIIQLNKLPIHQQQNQINQLCQHFLSTQTANKSHLQTTGSTPQRMELTYHRLQQSLTHIPKMRISSNGSNKWVRKLTRFVTKLAEGDQ
jgi:hypothetical protein